MSQHLFLAEAARWVVQCAFWSSIAFVGWYSLLAPWWRLPIGRAIVALDSAIAFALLPSVIGLLWGEQAVVSVIYQWLTVCALGCVPVITCWRMVIVWRIQKRGADSGR
jgi:hypothetical protein